MCAVLQGVELGHRTLTIHDSTPIPREAYGRNLPSTQYRTVGTVGDGACAIHSVFGLVCPMARELYMQGARKFAQESMRQLPAEGAVQEQAIELFKHIRSSIWYELALPNLSREHETTESRCFWKTLKTNAPGIESATREHYRQRQHAGLARAEIQRIAIQSGCDFFKPEFEAICVRSIAVKLGYIPGTLRIECRCDADNGTSAAKVIAYQSEVEELADFPGLMSAESDGYVKGTRSEFPVDGPACMYSAFLTAETSLTR